MRILVGMSGGLDSTYAAKALLAEGHEIEGAVLLLHPYTELSAAESAAAQVGIPLHVIDGRERFQKTVQENFVQEYLRGRTPNPCIVCNREVKFSLLYEYAVAHGFDAIATGHYATVVRRNTRFAIAQGRDEKKDQSYVLWPLSQEILSHLILPLAAMEKECVRRLAREEALSVANRAESQEICFIPDGDYARFVTEAAGVLPKEGDFVDENGVPLGRHKGIIHYTVGQRKGLGIALGKRMFVTAISSKTNEITLSENPNATVSSFLIKDMIFSGMEEPEQGSTVQAEARVRYLAPLRPASVIYLGGGQARVHLATAARAVTPGQSCVFYGEGIVLFGGIISSVS